MKQFKCSHCGHVFDAEPKDGLECPLCFWSSSLSEGAGGAKKDRSESETPRKESQPLKSSKPSSWIPSLVAVFFILLTLSLLSATIFFGMRFQKVLFAKKESVDLSFKDESKGGSSGLMAGDPLAWKKNLKPEDLALLERKISLTANRPLSEEESKILKFHASFSTGMRETLPSKIWTEADFKNLLETQQKMYRVPLPWSYRKKLEKLFKEKYLAGETAFDSGDLIRARDAWVEALAFPIYGNDIRLHRGVVLTMLRSYINDTLSKIGAVNSSISEKKIRDQEMVVSQKYQELFPILEKSDWISAADSIRVLDQLLDQLENPSVVGEAPPPYPAAVAQIDEGIRATLQGIQEVPRAPVSSFNALRVDLHQKLSLAQSFQADRMAEIQTQYDQALDAISRSDFAQAEKLLHEIDYPLAVYQDAQEKIRILRKLQASAISSDSTPPESAQAVPVRVSVKKASEEADLQSGQKAGGPV